jgi:hypothetical protein
MWLEGPTMLRLSNLKQLKTFDINSPNNITELIINNIDNSAVNSKTILKMISEENIVKY